MIENLLLNNPWFPIAMWVIVYTADYYLTLYGAQLYYGMVKTFIVFAGSYELTPAFQEDVDKRRLVSRQFLSVLILFSMMFLAIWWLSVSQYRHPEVFALFFGGFFLVEVAIIMRHLRNITLFRIVRRSGGLRGRIEYTRRLTLMLSSAEFYTFAGLYLLTFLLSNSWFFLGGAALCVVNGYQHSRRANRASFQQRI